MSTPSAARPASVSDSGHRESLRRRLSRARFWTRLSLFWERLWPRLLPLLGVVAAFLIVSWFGLWPQLNDWLRLGLLGLFGVSALASLWPVLGLRWPSRADADARLEIGNALEHRPITAQTDRQVTGTGNALSRALWQAERRRAERRLADVAAQGPVPKVAHRDPFALRAAVALVLFIAFLWPADRTGAIMEAFRNDETRAIERARIDVWVTPPPYTNRPPVFLARSETLAAGEEPATRTVEVPEGSQLVVRTVGLDGGRLTFDAGQGAQSIVADREEAERPVEPNPNVPTRRAYTFDIPATGTVQLAAGEKELAQYGFTIIPDRPPTIAFAEDPSPANNGALEIKYRVTDDYAVRSARASIAPVTDDEVKVDGDARPLVDFPAFDLSLPRRNTKDGTGRVNRDLTAHPLAGARVTITLEATDDAKQTAQSAPHEMVLPQRPFREPLAKALVSERRKLALDARRQGEVANMLDIISSTHPEEFIPELGTYTAIRIAYRQTRNARNDDELREVLDLLWEIALGIEDGDLSAAERRLRDAQERLAEALENGASDEEIQRLMQELRDAMDEFMREMARRAQENPQNAQPMPNQNMQELSRRDLDRMMDRIEDLARSGSRDAARELLSEMQRMMDNMQAGRQQPQQGQQGQQSDEFSKQMNELAELLRKQQELMDQTHEMRRRQREAEREARRQGQQGQQGQQGERRQGQRGQQGQRQPGQQGQQGERGQRGQQGQGSQGQGGQGGERPMTPEELAEALRNLQRQQGDLQQRLQQLQEGLESLGMAPSEGLGQADREMGRAGSRLGQGEPGAATGNQGRALEAMRQGAQQMMQQLQQMAREQGRQGQQPGQGQGEGMGEQRNRDPLGRQTRSRGPQLGNDVKVPDEIDAQRAREILDAIRRRLSDTTRRRLELDYLDRLLPGGGFGGMR